MVSERRKCFTLFFHLLLYRIGHLVKDHSDSQIEKRQVRKTAAVTSVAAAAVTSGATVRLAARALLHTPSNRQDSTYPCHWCTNC